MHAERVIFTLLQFSNSSYINTLLLVRTIDPQMVYLPSPYLFSLAESWLCRKDVISCRPALGLWKTLKYWHIVDLHIPHRDNNALGA
jgi:hypothetical protein